MKSAPNWMSERANLSDIVRSLAVILRVKMQQNAEPAEATRE